MEIDEFVNTIIKTQRSKVDLDLLHRLWKFDKSVNVENNSFAKFFWGAGEQNW